MPRPSWPGGRRQVRDPHWQSPDPARRKFSRLTVVGIGVVAAAMISPIGDSLYQTILETPFKSGARKVGLMNKPQAFRIEIEENPDKIVTESGEPVGATYLLPLPIASVPPAPDAADSCLHRFDWATQQDGVQSDVSNLRLTVEGISEDNVQIVGVHARTVARNPPSLGSQISCEGRGGQPPLRSITVDLDANPPTAQLIDAAGKPIPILTLMKGEVEIIDVTASSFTCDCQWELVFDMKVAGEAQSVVVRGASGPFRTASSQSAKAYTFTAGSWHEQESGMNSGSPMRQIPGTPVPDACSLLTEEELAAILGQPFKTERATTSVTNGAAVPIEWASCTWSSTTLPASVPPSGVLNSSVTDEVHRAADSEKARLEFDAMIRGYGQGADTSIAVPGVGDQAVIVSTSNGPIFLSRKGSLVGIAYVSKQTAVSNDATVDLGRKFSDRLFGLSSVATSAPESSLEPEPSP